VKTIETKGAFGKLKRFYFSPETGESLSNEKARSILLQKYQENGSCFLA
jgi:hypothetical protein